MLWEPNSFANPHAPWYSTRMVTVEISRCEKSLNFAPLKPCSLLLPAYAWAHKNRAYLLSGFEREAGQAVVLEGELAPLLCEVYGILTLSECARVSKIVKEVLELNFDPSPCLGYRVTSDWPKLAGLVAHSPVEFQNWISLKGVGSRDLEILTLGSVAQLTPVLNKIARLNPTKSTGSLILELCTHLLGQDKPIEEILTGADHSSDEWLKRLNRQRYPQTALKDEEQESRLKRLPWPAHSQVKWIRNGDQSGVEVRFQIFSDKDLARKLEGLENVKQAIAGDLWKPN
jgi:hypothetical protein